MPAPTGFQNLVLDSNNERNTSDDINSDISYRSVGYIYSCRRCNEILFEYKDLHQHSRDNNQSLCTSYYLEEYPLLITSTLSLPSTDHLNHHEWSNQPYLTSTTESTNLKDKIYCHKCKSRIGSYSWSGSQCSCLIWIVPSFQFIKSKIDCRIVNNTSSLI